MKKLTFLAGAALVCALVCPGCSGDGFDEMNGAPDAGNPDTPALGEGIRTLTVGMAELGAPGTRASFGDEAGGKLPVFWDAEDRIVAYETVGEHAAGHAYKLVGPGGSGSGTFAYDGGQTPPSAIAEIYYPAELAGTNFAVPAVQTYTPGSFDPAAHVMRAEVGNPGEPIVFGSLVSVACLRLTGDGERVTSVRLDLTPSGGATASYTLSCPDGVTLSAAESAFYIAVEGSATPCDAVFTVSVDGVETMVQKTTSAKTFAASTVVRLPVVACQRNLYQIADYWPDDDAPVGIVFSVSDGGLHGKMLSLTEQAGNWGAQVSEATAGVAGMRVEPEDSRLVTRSLIDKYKDEPGFADTYKGFYWIYNTLNNGNPDGAWYAPSRPELAELCAAMSGLDWAEVKRTWNYTADKTVMPGWEETSAARTAFKQKVEAKGTTLNLYGRLSSTWENGDGKSAWMLCFQYEAGGLKYNGCFCVIPKVGATNRMRAVRTF
ncbi:hypothetical protein [Alistipes timonensis]|nr:hypothetical protein [Alistipes timonensis]